ncbi:glycoside hydrolase family 16 protein [Zasmidium cellare ATCC 36951]|uniref:endo-1,3(4)-beta-glucanase n=1 Tax=Zasmidium cellare ATCC 36951 TaxID=1080233 RepID=A0A6A6CRA3_ZASCE|nr:glycoside hydrolase family 16 protein [Zasmidium cellare ATCC 36951]KAF2168670.1 glycoside hydrolase family 16 protein [Zasmidium cellare ATCC 36951]
MFSSQNTIKSAQAYALVDSYTSSNWMSKFSVQSISDPTHGYVNYVNQQQAQSQGLYKVIGNQVYVGVDNTSVLNPSGTGRNSVRLMSNTAYNQGLVIGDFAHIPGTECGSWPAFWMVGPNWPSSGEIDIIEGVNLMTTNQMTLHTSPGCTVSVGSGGQSGSSVGDPACGDGGGYNGCPVVSNTGTSYGTPFDNVKGGGVYAMQWTGSNIKIWYFPRNAVPSDISSGKPNPGGWGQPQANFAGCDFSSYMKNQNIIFDITFCGDWAGQVWNNYASCKNSNPSCNGYVAQNPNVFSDVYWLVNSVKVYQ